MATTSVPLMLQVLFDDYRQDQQSDRFPLSYTFLGKRVGFHLHSSMAHKILKATTDRIGVGGHQPVLFAGLR